MGRAKLNMELIKKDKTRRVTYRKRKDGLMRKMHEFTTLCGVNACAIIYGSPDDEEPDAVWPKNNDDEIRRLIDLYESKGKNTNGNRSYGLVDYFDDRNKKMEDELRKLRKANEDTSTANKYPTWFSFMNGLSEMQLREFGDCLDRRIEFVKNRLDSIKGKDSNESGTQQVPGLIHNGVELQLTYNQPHLNSMEEAIPLPVPATQMQTINNNNNRNSMMTLLLNENASEDELQLQIESGTSSHINLRDELGAGAGAGAASSRVVENVVYNPRPLSYYYPVPPQSYLQMQYPLFPGVSPDQLVTLRDIHEAQMTGIIPWFF